MAKITREDVLKIARMSSIALRDDEVDGVRAHLESILSYAERVQQVGEGEINLEKNVNVMREDVVIPTNPEPILNEAPERQDRYFVVPKILENS